MSDRKRVEHTSAFHSPKTGSTLPEPGRKRRTALYPCTRYPSGNVPIEACPLHPKVESRDKVTNIISSSMSLNSAHPCGSRPGRVHRRITEIMIHHACCNLFSPIVQVGKLSAESFRDPLLMIKHQAEAEGEGRCPTVAAICRQRQGHWNAYSH